MGAKWTREEISYLKSNLPIPEIARKIGRTEAAVRDKRHKMRIVPSEGIFMPEAMSPYEKEVRILKLAQRFGIKLEVNE